MQPAKAAGRPDRGGHGTGAPLRPHCDVGAIARDHGPQLLKTYPPSAEQAKVLQAWQQCRTAALGGHMDLCNQCGHERPAYNSCRNRHCPKCQSLAQRRWLDARRQRTLPVHHFHVVFTLPAELRPLMRCNQRLLFALLFRSASSCLLDLAKDARFIGATVGVTAVLHTWSRDLGFHPHLHCVVTGGGLSEDGNHWKSTREGFLFPLRVMGALFRGRFLDALAKLYRDGQLNFAGQAESLASPVSFGKLLDKLYRHSWVVYSKPPFGGTDAVFAYLGRYTHRVGISNARLLDVTAGRVTFRTQYQKQVTLTATEFLRRLLMHVLPTGFVRIRHYGLLAPGNIHSKLARAQQLLDAPSLEPQKHDPPLPIRDDPDELRVLQHDEAPDYIRAMLRVTGVDLRHCPRCSGTMQPTPFNHSRGPP